MRSRIEKKKRRVYWKAVMLLLLFTGVWFGIERQLKPIVKMNLAYTGHNYAENAINNAVLDEMSQYGDAYTNLVSFSYKTDGTISSIHTDTVRINLLQGRLTKRILEVVSEFDHDEIVVPWGTLLGSQFLSARGPKVSIRLIPASFVETGIYNSFTAVGINQTRHQILLKVQATISGIIPGCSVTEVVEKEICLAETVIVGAVPDTYAVLDSQTDPMIGIVGS